MYPIPSMTPCPAVLVSQVYISREDIHRCAEDISDYLIQRGAFAKGPVGGR